MFPSARTLASRTAIRFHKAALAVLTLLVASSVSAASAQGPASRTSATDPAVRALEASTLSLLTANAHVRGLSGTARTGAIATLTNVAADRLARLEALLPEAPAEVLAATLPPTLRATLPQEAAPYLEQDLSVDGVLVVYHVDGVAPAPSRFLYFLDSDLGRLPLYFAKDAPQLRTGAKVRVNAAQIGDALLAQSGTSSIASADTTKAAALSNTLGAQRTLMIYANFSDNAAQPFTMSAAQSAFTTMSNYWYETSYQQTWLVGDVAGWFTLPLSSATCDYNSFASYAKQAAAAAGYVLGNYDHFVYVFPHWAACAWTGMGQIGGLPTDAWINPSATSLPVASFAHEMGHNLGLYHAHSLSCPGGAPIAATGCTSNEYGDGFDTMAAPQQMPHYNAFMKELLGWLGAGVSPPLVAVPAVAGSATYTIAPAELPQSGVPRALKIPRTAACGTAGDYFYVESRQAIGFDSYIAGLTAVPYGSPISPATDLQTGVLVHDAIPGGASVSGSLNSSLLLDMAASTTGWAGPALVAGASFTDPVSGVTLAPLSVGSSSSTISVTYPPASCVHAAPKVTFTPTATDYTTAGTAVSYVVTVTNNDSCACAASTFNVGATPPTGWTASSAVTPSLAPGASGSGSIAVTSPISATAAFYTVALAATNAVAPTATASASATIAITSAAAAPSISLSPTGTQTVAAGGTAAYTATVTNTGSTSASFTVSVTVPSGWSATAPQAVTIAAGASVPVALSITAAASATTGTFTVPVNAVNTSSASASASANATIYVPAATLSASVTTNRANYTRPSKRNQTTNASITTSVTSGGAAVSGAAVSIKVTDPGGSVTSLSGKTGSNGSVALNYPIRATSRTGTYAVASTATSGSRTATATASFVVQ